MGGDWNRRHVGPALLCWARDAPWCLCCLPCPVSWKTIPLQPSELLSTNGRSVNWGPLANAPQRSGDGVSGCPAIVVAFSFHLNSRLVLVSAFHSTRGRSDHWNRGRHVTHQPQATLHLFPCIDLTNVPGRPASLGVAVDLRVCVTQGTTRNGQSTLL